MNEKEKAIAYDKALERAKDCLKDGTITSTAIDYISTIFPELGESEDERIRKGIIDFLWKEKIFLQEVSSHVENNPKYRFVMDAIAWLEKQKDTNVLIQEASEKAYTEGMRVEREHWLEKQGGQKSVESLRDYNDIDPHFGIPVEDLKSKEKTVDKVEAKFHEGDWIVHHGTENIYQVVAVIDNQYQLKYGDNYTIQNCADVDRCARLWDVAKDTKDGDVLHLGCVIAIFKKYIGQEKCICYCSISEDEDFEIPTEDGEDNIYGCTNTTPATKEQRDTLFKAMADAGYTFDFEKKELKKIDEDGVENKKQIMSEMTNLVTTYIKQKSESTWSEEDEEELGIAIEYLQRAGQWDSATWLKSLRTRLGGSEHDNVTSKTTNVSNSSITVEEMYNPTKDASV